MTGLVTVEDYNSALLNYDDILELVVDGSKFPEGETHFMYDFLEVEIDGTTIKLTNHSSFKYIGYRGDVTGSVNVFTGKFSFNNISDPSSFYATILLDSTAPPYQTIVKFENFQKVIWGGFANQPKKLVLKEDSSLNISAVFYIDNVVQSQQMEKVQIGDEYYYSVLIPVGTLTNPVVWIRTTSDFAYKGAVRPFEFKNPNFVNITGNLYVGKKSNTLTIQPFMAGTDENPITCKVRYLNKEQTFTLEGSQTIKVDLREYTKTTPLTLTVELSEGPYTNKETLTYEVPVTYQTVNTQTQLLNELTNNEGTQILRLGANITLPYNSRIPILHDAIIIGNNKTLKLNHSSLVIQEGKTLKIQDTTIYNGDNAIIQKDNTLLEMDGCTFKDCTSRQGEGLGSCVYCDIDLDSLTVPNDFTTNINNTTFKDCHGAILHGGKLTVTNSTYKLETSNTMNTHSPYFLYQTDGEATLTGNVFDVDILENVYDCEPLLSAGAVTRYDTNTELITVIQSCRAYLADSDTEATINNISDTQGVIEDIHFCEAEKSANLGQCLFMLGEDANINGQDKITLTNPSNLNFLNTNVSHIFMKYYYPEVEACVYISPIVGFETKALCYALSGLDWIYKVNAQITRASWQTENVNNPLREA